MPNEAEAIHTGNVNITFRRHGLDNFQMINVFSYSWCNGPIHYQIHNNAPYSFPDTYINYASILARIQRHKLYNTNSKYTLP